MSNSNFYRSGYDLALQNAKTLFNVANIACNEKAYGVACSLNILSSEETLKAGFLSIKCYNPDGKLNAFEKIFHKHQVKHEQLKEFVEFQKNMQAIMKLFVDMHKPVIDTLKETSALIQLNNVKEISDLENDLLLFKRSSELSLNMPGVLNWLENANNEKNRGFYVDKGKDNWFSPSEIQQARFITEREYTLNFIEFVEITHKCFSMLDKK